MDPGGRIREAPNGSGDELSSLRSRLAETGTVTRFYIDAMFYIALLHQPDALRLPARALAHTTLEDVHVTSEPVLTEFLDYFCGRGAFYRGSARFVDQLRSDPRTTILPQTPELFAAGLDLYRRRPDKGYSLTDCMSMAICTDQKIEQVLTHDRHFAQEGFEILL
jgi:predicted nucleic acid-binding protein